MQIMDTVPRRVTPSGVIPDRAPHPQP